MVQSIYYLNGWVLTPRQTTLCTFDIAANRTGASGGTLLFRLQENGNVGIGRVKSNLPKLNVHVAENPHLIEETSDGTIARFRGSNGEQA